jgi:hypothetical protein
MTKKTIIKTDDNFAQSFFNALVENFASDPDKETGKGIEYNFLPHGILMIHRAGNMNKAYNKLLLQKSEEMRGQNNDDLANKYFAEVYAKTIIVGLKTPDGTPVTYGKAEQDAISEILARPDMTDIFTGIREAAQNAANFRKERIEADAKNSVKS